MTDQVIVWADVETTGLRPGHLGAFGSGDQLLEVAALITDYNLNILDDAGFHRIVAHDKDVVRAIANDYVKSMHDRTGLWDRLAEGDPEHKIDAELLEYIRVFSPEPRKSRLAGNSVRLDANFFDEFLPQTAAHLHYRLLDVSTIGFEAYEARGIPVMRKRGEHTAMSDIRESIEELRYLRSQLYRAE